MKQAWLIIAHNEFGVLQRLVTMLDSPESDFFIHFDKKLKSLPEIQVKKGNLTVVKNRIDVRWGTISQIRVELLLMEEASKTGPYAHYHILSGTHLPLKPMEEIITFYDAHSQEEVMRFWQQNEGEADFKIRRFHFPIRNMKSTQTWLRKLTQWTWTAVLKVQKIFGIRHYTKDVFFKTDQWLSLTEAACRFLVNQKTSILRKYKLAFCPDEFFIASELMKHPDSFRLYDCQNLLYVVFVNESPKSFALSDYSAIQDSGCYWARKFTSAS